MKRMRALLFILFLSGCLPAYADEFRATMATVDLGKLTSGRPGIINLWFPSGRCPEPKVPLCLANSALTHKVIVLSHGTMGSAGDYAWLGERLAAAGFVVVGINHYGESRIYGKATQDVHSSAFIWQRALDISAVLDRLARDNPFQRAVNWGAVVALGHSAGGQTAALLAGARFDVRRLVDYCESASGQVDRSCNYGRNHSSAPEPFIRMFNGSYQDVRVKKIILLDPALGPALQQDSLSDLVIPSLIVGATNNDFLPWESHGQRYVSAIPGAHTILLDGQEGHFVFLASCRHRTKVMGVPLCEDRPGVDRRMVQHALAQQIVDFVRVDDEPVTVASVTDNLRQSGYSSTQRHWLLQVLLYTPRWVFGLLTGLCILGLLQTRTRRVVPLVALVFPVVMLALSLNGVLRYVGWQWPALLCWLTGIGIVAAANLKWLDAETTRYDTVSRRLIIKGSWLPLIVILGIFMTRYALGVASATGSALFQTWYFPPSMGLLLGGWSGFFLARVLASWRAVNRTAMVN